MTIAYFGNVVLCMPFNGTNGSTVFTDYSHTPKYYTLSSSPSVSTGQYKYYGSSLYLESSERVIFVKHSDFELGSGDFSIEFWHKNTNTSAGIFQDILKFRDTSASNNCFIIYRYGNSIQAEFSTSGTSVEYYVAKTRTADTNWYHFCIERYGSNLAIAVDGVFATATNVGTANFYKTTSNLELGSPSYALGYFQDLKFTKKSVYNLTNFTPPTQILKTISGTVKDDTNSNAIRTIAAVPRSSGSRAFWTASAADGTYSLSVPDVEHSVICMDNDSGTLYNDLIARVLPG